MASRADGGASPYSIGGSLPWGNAGGSAALGATDPGQIAAAYGGAYNNALAMNQSNYNNILSGYQQLVGNSSTAQSAISAGYGDLYNNVLGQISNSFGANAQQINTAANQQLSQGSQQLIDRGLGNTTVQQSLNRGVNTDLQRQLLGNTNAQAQMTGSYMSQLGTQQLQSQQQGLNNTNQLAENQLGFMNSVQAQYPNAGLYASLAQQAALNKKPLSSGWGAGGAFGTPGPQLGYVPSNVDPIGPGGGYGSPGGTSGMVSAAGAPASSWNTPNPAYAPSNMYAEYDSSQDDYGDPSMSYQDDSNPSGYGYDT